MPYENKLDISVKEKWRALLPAAEDHSENIKALWRTNNTLYKSDIGSYLIDKKGVEELDFKPLEQLLKQLTRTKKSSVQNRNKTFVGFWGYDEDPREIYEIPEIRKWYSHGLEMGFPWFYLLTTTGYGMAIMTFLLCCANFEIVKKDAQITAFRFVDFEDINSWMCKNLINLNRFTENLGLSDDVNAMISEDVLNLVKQYLDGTLRVDENDPFS